MNDVISLLKELDIPFQQHGESSLVTRGWVGLECVFCGKGTGKKGLGINLQFGSVYCWKCGPHSLAEVLREITNESWTKCREWVKGLRPLVPRTYRPMGKLVVPKGVGPMLPCHRNYLRSRKLDPDEVEKIWKVQGIGLAAKLAWRLFIPISFHGEMVSWTTRGLTDETPRYITAKPEQEKIAAKRIGMGWEYVRHTVYIVEGPFDCIRIGPGAVATLGTSWTKAQLRLFSEVPRRVVVFDSDSEAQRRAKQLCNALSCFFGRTYRVELDSPDPGSASQREIQKLRKCFS